jgi:iron complex transport system permease protein
MSVVKNRIGVVAGLGLLTVLLFLVYVGIGSYAWLTPGQVAHEILRGPVYDGATNNIVWAIRLPRGLYCVFVGGILGVVGSVFQAQLRNRLAEPYVIGVSSGAAVGGALALVLGWGTALAGFGMCALGFVTGMLSLALVIFLARRGGVVERGTLLLAGVLVGAFLSAILTTILLGAGQDTNRLLYWLMGSMSPAHLPQAGILAGTLVIGFSILMTQSKRLNALAFGEATALRLGVDVPRLTRIVLVTGTAMVSVTVGTVGIIGFLGLVAPHVARRIIGIDWRWSLPTSMLCGSILLTIADLIAQRGLPMVTHELGLEPPVGLVTALVGAPVLLVLLKKRG